MDREKTNLKKFEQSLLDEVTQRISCVTIPDVAPLVSVPSDYDSISLYNNK